MDGEVICNFGTKVPPLMVSWRDKKEASCVSGTEIRDGKEGEVNVYTSVLQFDPTSPRWTGLRNPFYRIWLIAGSEFDTWCLIMVWMRVFQERKPAGFQPIGEAGIHQSGITLCPKHYWIWLKVPDKDITNSTTTKLFS